MAHLYVMQRSDAPELLKVGRSDKPLQRAESLQSGHCFFTHVLAIFRNVGRHERKVHEQLEKFKVQNGAGREWFQTDLSSIYCAIGRVSEGISFPTPIEWCNNVGDYITLTQSALEASDAAEIRSAIAGVAKLTKQQVDESLRMDGFKEVTTHH